MTTRGTTPDLTHDAVVVVPGIMGSALREATGRRRVLWGLNDLRWLGRAWSGGGEGMRPLHLDYSERNGRYGRVEATGLLRLPAWAPFLQGLEPYGPLVAAVREKVADRAAVLEFAYDWRLPVQVNGALLAAASHRHLTAWRATEAHQRARRHHPDGRPAQLVFVAHSMGGLVTRAAFAHSPGLRPESRAVITLGTPFLGAPKSALILNGDRASPALPQRRMQELAATLPGVHDLLPDYRCVDTGHGVTRLSPADVALLGGDKELASQAMKFQQSMRDPESPSLPGHSAVVGIDQPTVQSLRLDSGVVHAQYVSFARDSTGNLSHDPDTGLPARRNRAGDGTVSRDSAASHPAAGTTWLPLQHGSLAKDGVALAYVRAVLTGHDASLGPALGSGTLGLQVPDHVEAGQPWLLRLLPSPGEELDSHAGIACGVHNAEDDRLVDAPRPGWYDGTVAAPVTLPEPGLYRVRVAFGGGSPLTQLVLALPPAVRNRPQTP
ncbi:hypothetical protein ACIPSE_40735 [Streptomyces sp. NPDC090106]|uniref:lipase/acyltransferase domain-containing protein n=1 Tax=Streptomyces sp. NPDC090106 TaxID=3365946 RepID=UPI00381FD8FB